MICRKIPDLPGTDTLMMFRIIDLTTRYINFRRRWEPSFVRGVDYLTKPAKNNPATTEIVRVRLPKKRNREIFAQADLMLGANHIRVRCFDGVTRLGRIKGKIKKRLWIREGDILIVVPWSFQDDKCDIYYRYTRPQVDWLRKNNYLND